MFVCLFVVMFCPRPWAKWSDHPKYRQGEEVDGHGKQCTRHDIFSRGSTRCMGWGHHFRVKMFPAEMHGSRLRLAGWTRWPA